MEAKFCRGVTVASL